LLCRRRGVEQALQARGKASWWPGLRRWEPGRLLRFAQSLRAGSAPPRVCTHRSGLAALQY